MQFTINLSLLTPSLTSFSALVSGDLLSVNNGAFISVPKGGSSCDSISTFGDSACSRVIYGSQLTTKLLYIEAKISLQFTKNLKKKNHEN